MGYLRAFARLMLFLLLTAVFFLPTVLCYYFHHGLHRAIVTQYYKALLSIVGITIYKKGKIGRKPSLFICNHCSYLDIPILGAHLPVRFMPKQEIRRWPLIGWLTSLSRPVYIDRAGRKVKAQSEELMRHIRRGDSILLFPEATTGKGGETLPFKPGMFQVALDHPGLRLVPVTLRYVKLEGKPIAGQAMFDRVAWYGDMTLVPHLWKFLQLKSLTAELIIHKPVRCDRFATRKELARHCREVVARSA